jgi:hypothetical protein
MQQLCTVALESARFLEGIMNASQISILMYGRDAHLLETSQWALRSRGYRVLTATTLAEFDSIPHTPPINLLVLGHTLTPGECGAAAAHAATRWPAVKKLTLTHDNSSTSGGVLGRVRHTLDVSSGLLARVSELVGYASSSSCSHIY